MRRVVAGWEEHCPDLTEPHWYGCKFHIFPLIFFYINLKNICVVPNFIIYWNQVTPMHVAYEEAKKDAGEIGVAVTGSELVGFPVVAIFKNSPYLGWSCASCLPAGCCGVLHGEGRSDGPWGRPKGGHGHECVRKKDPLVHQSLVQFLTLRVPGSPCHQQTWPLHPVAI